MDFYQKCSAIIDANAGNESVAAIINEIKNCQMMYNCSIFTKELRRYIRGLRENNPYDEDITKYKMEKEPDSVLINLDEHKAKVLRTLLPWEQKKLYMKAVIASLKLHQSLNDKDIQQLLKAMVNEDAGVFRHYNTGQGKLLTSGESEQA